MKVRDYGDWTEIYTRHPRSVPYNDSMSVLIKGHMPEKEMEQKYPYYYDYVYYRHGEVYDINRKLGRLA